MSVNQEHTAGLSLDRERHDEQGTERAYVHLDVIVLPYGLPLKAHEHRTLLAEGAHVGFVVLLQAFACRDVTSRLRQGSQWCQCIMQTEPAGYEAQQDTTQKHTKNYGPVVWPLYPHRLCGEEGYISLGFLDAYKINRAIQVLLTTQETQEPTATQALKLLQGCGAAAIPKLLEACARTRNAEPFTKLLKTLVQEKTLPLFAKGLTHKHSRVAAAVVDVLGSVH